MAQAAYRQEEERYNFADCLSWEGRARMEIIGGELFMMAPPRRRHQEISGELFAQFYEFLRGKPCRVYAAPFAVRLFEREGERPEDVDTMVEPDLTVVCGEEKLDEYGCKGAPELVIEILSPATRRRDSWLKYQLYERAGVREYWIVDPESRSVQVFVLDEGHYGAGQVYTAGALVPVSLWEDFRVELRRVFPGEESI